MPYEALINRNQNTFLDGQLEAISSPSNVRRFYCAESMAANDSNMDSHSYQMKWKKGINPYEGKWPGAQHGRVEIADGMQITWDVQVPLRDGARTYVDILRPQQNEGPLPIILTYSPYGKQGPKTSAMFPNSGVPEGSVSKYAVWEGPDPKYWTQKGYAMINADTRGSWGSDGDLEILGPQQGQDGYDIVEWAAALPWSNGRIGLAGVSYLAIIQWRVAETNPPHLACINPWEGFTEVYRDYSHHGGIPETNFLKFTEWSCRCGFGNVEDWVTMQRDHYLYDNYQASKTAKLSQIRVPAYIVADWGDQGLHTRGALEGFSNIRSEQKWLEVHGRKKWQYYYQGSSLLRQEAFFQKFLKGQPSAIDTWPQVQIEIRERAFHGIVRAESEWPLNRAKHILKYLDSSSGQLTNTMVPHISSKTYDSEKQGDHIDFLYTFQEETELTGSMRLRLWVSTDKGDDMDVFVQLDKLDVKGVVMPFVVMSMIDTGPMALGWLRVSHRELDHEKSTINRPWLLHQREPKLRPNEIVPCDLEILPSSTRFFRGESLRITIQGNDIFRYELAQVQLHEDSVNSGRHFIHTGGPYDSHLVLPCVQPDTK